MDWTLAIGVDTDKKVHVAVALDRLGAQLDSREFPTTQAGYRALLSWAQELGVPAFAIEGTGSYGAGLVRFLERAGVAVYECERPRRQERGRGKNDLIEAALAARRLLSGERLSLPRGGGRREDFRVLLLERRSAMRARTAALNQLSALSVTAPEQLRERLEALSGERLAQRRSAARLERRPESNAKRGILSPPSPARARRSLKWQKAAPPAEPRRRSPAQLGTARHRPPAGPPSPRDQRLPPAPPRSRKDRQGSPPLPQTRPRPPLLPTPLRDPLLTT
jgi:transposase